MDNIQNMKSSDQSKRLWEKKLKKMGKWYELANYWMKNAKFH